MTQFVVLSNEKHSQLRLKRKAIMAYAATQQAIPIEAVEVSKACANFPVFFMKDHHDEMTLSAIAGFEPGASLFMRDAKWDATYLPACLQTYPFYLMRSPDDETEYTVGIQEDNPSFSATDGELLFDGEGKATKHLEHVTNILKGDLTNIQATVKMVTELERLSLFKPVELLIHYQDNTAKKINGLFTVDDQKLNALPANELELLNKYGFLLVIHAMLVSIYQVNNLVNRHNASDDTNKISEISVELAQEEGAAS